VSWNDPALPGADLVARGLADLDEGIESEASLLVAIGAPRLRRLGLPLPDPGELPANPESRLYRLLCRSQGNAAHSAYNALVRRLVSFERALELRVSRELRLRSG
jgi:hypothetical protein